LFVYCLRFVFSWPLPTEVGSPKPTDGQSLFKTRNPVNSFFTFLPWRFAGGWFEPFRRLAQVGRPPRVK